MKESAQFRSFLVSGNGTFYGQSSSWAMSAPSARSRDYYSGTHATYSLQDVAKHCTPEDCWVIIHNAVYDVSNYLDKHPGGAGLVLKCAGSDATSSFEAMYHSSRARGILETLKIGELNEKAKNLNGLRLGPYAAGALKPGTAKGSGPYGLGAYDPKSPLSRIPGPPNLPQRPPIDQVAWRRYELLSVTKVNHDTSIFRFQIPNKARLNMGLGKHLSLGLTVDNKMIKRDYTPITDEPGYFELLVKKYPEGPVSSHLHNIKVGDGVFLRGLFGTLEPKPNFWKKLFIFAAGTGIAPMLPFIRYFVTVHKKEVQDAAKSADTTATKADAGKRASSLPKIASSIHVIFSNKTNQDILLKEELDKAAETCNGLLSIDYFLSQEEVVAPGFTYGRINDECVNNLKERFVDAFVVKEESVNPDPATFALICGPDNFASSVKQLLVHSWGCPETALHVF